MNVLFTCPAYDVVDLEAEVLDLKPEVCESYNFCVANDALRGGKKYDKVSVNCVAYYAPASVEKAKAEGQTMHWINLCGATLTAEMRNTEMRILLKEGQRVLMAGEELVVVNKGRGFWGFKAA